MITLLAFRDKDTRGKKINEIGFGYTFLCHFCATRSSLRCRMTAAISSLFLKRAAPGIRPAAILNSSVGESGSSERACEDSRGRYWASEGSRKRRELPPRPLRAVRPHLWKIRGNKRRDEGQKTK